MLHPPPAVLPWPRLPAVVLALLLLDVAGCGDGSQAGGDGGSPGADQTSGGDGRGLDGGSPADSGAAADRTLLEGGGVDGGGGGDGGRDGAALFACSLGKRKFWAWDLSRMPPPDIEVEATCRGQSEHAYLFVTDDEWQKRLGQSQVEAILRAFDQAVPAVADQGIYQIDTVTFGPVPDVFDQDPRVYLLYSAHGRFHGYTMDGYFRSLDEEEGPASNRIEMLFLDAAAHDPASEYMLGVVAHELVHMILWQLDPSEASWLAELLAEAAMVRTGYLSDLAAARDFLAHPGTPLLGGDTTNYGALFLFAAHLYQRFGASILGELASDARHGLSSLKGVLESHGSDGASLFGEWAVANLLDAPGLEDGRFGYRTFADDLPLPRIADGQPDGSAQALSVPGFATVYLGFTTAAAGTLSLTVDAASFASLRLHAVTFPSQDRAAARVAALPLAAQRSRFDVQVPAGHDQVVFVLAAFDASAVAVSYSANFTP